MSKSWSGHHIENIKGEDYVLYKDYLEIERKADELQKIVNKKTRPVRVKNTITFIVSILCLLVAIIRLIQGKTIDAVLDTQFATILYMMYNEGR